MAEQIVIHTFVILFLLMISGNVQLNPGPDRAAATYNTPGDFKCQWGLDLMYTNVQILVAKLDFVRIWVFTFHSDVIVVSESCLSKTVLDSLLDIFSDGYNVYRTDRRQRGGGSCNLDKN